MFISPAPVIIIIQNVQTVRGGETWATNIKINEEGEEEGEMEGEIMPWRYEIDNQQPSSFMAVG